MARTNNYLIQARQAQERFTAYDQDALIAKLKLRHDPEYLYVTMLSESYRIHRKTGAISRETESGWADANSFDEVMTLLDLVCDSRNDRFLTGSWKSLTDFGLMFHRNLTEAKNDPWADRFESNPEGFRRACESLNGIPYHRGDIAYAIELFDGLPILVQLWFGDEDFPACLRFLLDENALMYLKYETMHYAKGLLLEKIKERM
jgi:hypothetical protein